MAKHNPKLPWLDDVEESNYPAAQDYLSLRWAPDRAVEAVKLLRGCPLINGFQPSDLLRSAKQEPLDMGNPGVMRELRTMISTGGISPILVVNLPEFCVIADGYHRTCLAYHVAPFRRIPMRMVTFVDPESASEHYRPLSVKQELSSMSPEAAQTRESETETAGVQDQLSIPTEPDPVEVLEHSQVTSRNGSPTVPGLVEFWWDEPEPEDEDEDG